MNDVMIIGTMSQPEFDHEINGDRIYKAYIYTERTSETVDIIPIFIPQYLCDMCPTRVRAVGEFRSHNTEPDDNGHKHLQLYLYVQNIYPAYGILQDECKIKLQGYICKTPVCRKTPRGKTITDLLLAVPRSNMCDRSDYIPVILWGDASDLNIGDYIEVAGRIQSRTYANGEKTAYEVSVPQSQLTKLK